MFLRDLNSYVGAAGNVFWGPMACQSPFAVRPHSYNNAVGNEEKN